MTKQQPSLSIIKKAVDFRHRNSECALVILSALRNHRKTFKSKRNSLLIQKLIAVTFSLWRGAFLANKSNQIGASTSSAEKFLTEVLSTNAIAFSQEYKMQNWTFNYYIGNAKLGLQDLHQQYGRLVPKCDETHDLAIDRWQYTQDVLE